MKTLILALLAAVATLGGDFNPYFLSDGLPSAYLCLGKSGEPILLRIPKSFLTEAEKDTNITLAVAKIYTKMVRVSEYVMALTSNPPIFLPPDKFEHTMIYSVEFADINGKTVELSRKMMEWRERPFTESTTTNRVYLDEKGAK
jgi:hypothetical protein